MRSRRYQKGSLQLRKQGGRRVWVIMWWDGETRRTRTLGPASAITKGEAAQVLAEILAPINAQPDPQGARISFGEFVRAAFYPLKRRQWKESTKGTTENRINASLIPELGEARLKDIDRYRLQGVLDRAAARGLAHNSVNLLKFDLRSIFELAESDGLVNHNPATALFTPRQAKRAEVRRATPEEMARAFATVGLRERLALKLAGIAGMRPGEIFGLTWANLQPPFAAIRQRVYEGVVDSPKSARGVRRAALAVGVVADVAAWREASPTAPHGWVFPSERIKTPMSAHNLWKRFVRPKLNEVGLGWLNFQVLRRSCASLLNDAGVEPKVVSDQLGHDLVVDLSTYARVSDERRLEAVNRLESSLRVN